MNGKDMLEAMGFVDEKYVQAAAFPARHRRRYWPGVAAAACAVLVIGAGLIAYRLNGQEAVTEELALSAAPAEDSAVYSGAEDSAEIALGGAFSGSTAPLEMTVRVLEQTGETLRCVVEDPGTGSFTIGQEITVVLDGAEAALSDLSRSSEKSENEAAPHSEDAEDSTEDAAEEIAAEEILWIQYTPGEEESTVTAIDWSFASEDGDS